MMHRWGRAPPSCQPCRDKKRRCDRQQPCSSCSLRNISCKYAHQDQTSSTSGQRPQETYSHTIYPSPGATSVESSHSDDVLRRLKRLEEAVFRCDGQPGAPASAVQPSFSDSPGGFTPFGLHLMSKRSDDSSRQKKYLADLITKLPPLAQARVLLEHFAVTSHPNCGILHIPSCQNVLEESYRTVGVGGTPFIENLLLLFGIFAGAAFLWSPTLLQQLHATHAESKAAFLEYSQLGMSIIDNIVQPLIPSTTALAAMTNLHYVTAHARGLSDNAVALRMKCYAMARILQIDRLDTAKVKEERKRRGCSIIETEIQRRIWWNLVGSDWLNAFSGGPNDGTYYLQPRYMCVRLPANIDDKDLTERMVESDIPLSIPSDMSAFIQRAKISAVCREVVDALPSQFGDAAEPDYETILQMDQKFRAHQAELPTFFQLDPESVEKSKDICRQRPLIALQRVGVNFSVHIRLCRLHRPYHLEGLTNPKYAYSYTACINEAQRVLELRRAMDDCAPLGMNPARSWIVMQHVSIAALILATDVSFNPSAPNAEDRKAKVLATCELLEKSIEESGSIMDGVQRNMQVLISTLQKKRPQGFSQHATLQRLASNHEQPGGIMAMETDGEVAQVPGTASVGNAIVNDGFVGEMNTDQTNWDQLWKDFIEIAPELDATQWDLLFEDVQPFQ